MWGKKTKLQKKVNDLKEQSWKMTRTKKQTEKNYIKHRWQQPWDCKNCVQEILATQAQIQQQVCKMVDIKAENENILKLIQKERQTLKEKMATVKLH